MTTGDTPDQVHPCQTPRLMPWRPTGSVWCCPACGEPWRVERHSDREESYRYWAKETP